MTQDPIQVQMDAIGRAMWPMLTEPERKMLEIRPAVSHGDIEIFLNGRFMPAWTDQIARIMAQDGIKQWVEGILPRLRGKRYIFDAETPPHTRGKYQYSYEMVLREVNYVLKTILGPVLTDKQVKSIQERVQAEILRTFNVVKRPRRNPDYTAPEYQLINKVLIEEIGKLIRRE